MSYANFLKKTLTTSLQALYIAVLMLFVLPGESVTLQCLVEAEPQPRIQWYFNNKEILSTSRTVIKNDEGFTTLTIHNCNTLDSGRSQENNEVIWV